MNSQIKSTEAIGVENLPSTEAIGVENLPILNWQAENFRIYIEACSEGIIFLPKTPRTMKFWSIGPTSTTVDAGPIYLLLSTSLYFILYNLLFTLGLAYKWEGYEGEKQMKPWLFRGLAIVNLVFIVLLMPRSNHPYYILSEELGYGYVVEALCGLIMGLTSFNIKLLAWVLEWGKTTNCNHSAVNFVLLKLLIIGGAIQVIRRIFVKPKAHEVKIGYDEVCLFFMGRDKSIYKEVIKMDSWAKVGVTFSIFTVPLSSLLFFLVLLTENPKQ